MSQTTASALQRVDACPASATLTQISEPSAAASRGVFIHAFLDACVKIGREAALVECAERWPEMAPALELIDLSTLPAGNPDNWLTEVAMSVDFTTGEAREILEFDEQHRYAISATEIAGTADVIGLTADSVIIYDYKTGRGDVTPPAQNLQLKFLAYAASRIHGRGKAVVGIIRVRESDEHFITHHQFDEFELAAVGAELAKIMARVGGVAPAISMGAWCRYCPAYRACPAQGKMLRELLDTTNDRALAEALGVDATAPDQATPLTLAEMGLAAFRIKHAIKRLEVMWDVVKGAAQTQPLPLPDGSELVAMLISKEALDGEAVFNVLQRQFNDSVAEAGTKSTLTSNKELIKKAIKDSDPALKGLGKLVDAVLQDVRKAGGVTTSSYTKLTEWPARSIGE